MRAWKNLLQVCNCWVFDMEVDEITRAQILGKTFYVSLNTCMWHGELDQLEYLLQFLYI